MSNLSRAKQVIAQRTADDPENAGIMGENYKDVNVRIAWLEGRLAISIITKNVREAFDTYVVLQRLGKRTVPFNYQALREEINKLATQI